MSSYYTMTIVLAVLSMFVMVLIAHNNQTMSSRRRHAFMLLAAVVAVSAAAEWTGVALQGTGPSTRLIHGLIKATELSCVPTLGPIAAGILDSSRPKSRLVRPLLIANAALEFLSIPFGIIFVVDASSVYAHAGLYWLYDVACLMSMAYLLFAATRAFSLYQSIDGHLLFVIMAFMLVGIAAQAIDSSIRVDWICVPMGTMFFYIYYTGIILETDVLTLLLNRRSYETRLSRASDPLTLVIFDVDHFKQVNDTYGHSTGDDSLKVIGALLRQVYAKYGRCYRIGGDEFCVVLKESAPVGELNSRFFADLTYEREERAWLPWVSMGYCRFDPANDAISDTVDRADYMMYRYKDVRREGRDVSEAMVDSVPAFRDDAGSYGVGDGSGDASRPGEAS